MEVNYLKLENKLQISKAMENRDSVRNLSKTNRSVVRVGLFRVPSRSKDSWV